MLLQKQTRPSYMRKISCELLLPNTSDRTDAPRKQRPKKQIYMSSISSIMMEAKAGRNVLEFSLQNIKNIPRFLHHDDSTHCLPLTRPNAMASQNAMLTPWLLHYEAEHKFIWPKITPREQNNKAEARE